MIPEIFKKRDQIDILTGALQSIEVQRLEQYLLKRLGKMSQQEPKQTEPKKAHSCMTSQVFITSLHLI